MSVLKGIVAISWGKYWTRVKAAPPIRLGKSRNAGPKAEVIRKCALVPLIAWVSLVFSG